MGRLEIMGAMAALAGIVGVCSMDALVEDRMIETTRGLMGMTQPEFVEWCGTKGATSSIELDETGAGTASCAWIDPDTERVWHTALHFDGIHDVPLKADAGLIDASASTLMRLVTNEFGAQDTHTGEGFPVWEMELDGRPGRVTVAPFEDLTVVRMAREDQVAVLSMR